MNTQEQINKKREVYSISGFRDTLASPIFYPVIVVSLVLGLTSIFGFVQNPLRLKSIVSVIQQKVATSNVVGDSFNANQDYFVSSSATNTQEIKNNYTSNMRTIRPQANYAFDLFPNTDTTEKRPVAGNFERIVFNYDVTSESFWTDLDSSRLETAGEEIERKAREASTFGVPLQIDYHENRASDFNTQDDSIYAINIVNRI